MNAAKELAGVDQSAEVRNTVDIGEEIERERESNEDNESIYFRKQWSIHIKNMML